MCGFWGQATVGRHCVVTYLFYFPHSKEVLSARLQGMVNCLSFQVYLRCLLLNLFRQGLDRLLNSRKTDVTKAGYD